MCLGVLVVHVCGVEDRFTISHARTVRPYNYVYPRPHSHTLVRHLLALHCRRLMPRHTTPRHRPGRHELDLPTLRGREGRRRLVAAGEHAQRRQRVRRRVRGDDQVEPPVATSTVPAPRRHAAAASLRQCRHEGGGGAEFQTRCEGSW